MRMEPGRTRRRAPKCGSPDGRTVASRLWPGRDITAVRSARFRTSGFRCRWMPGVPPVRDAAGDQIADRERGDAHERVEPVVVGGDDDAEERRHRVAARSSARNHPRRTSGSSTSMLHTAHAVCRLGIAAYWFDSFLRPPESNDQNVGYSCERVDEAEVLGDHRRRRAVLLDRLVEQARRHQREHGEADEREQRGERERVAPARIASRIAEEQPRRARPR